MIVLSSAFLTVLSQKISADTQSAFSIDHHRAVSGGDINHSFAVTDSSNQQTYFVKVNDAELEAMFVAEEAGLNTIAPSGVINVPKVITRGVFESVSFLVLEYLTLHPAGDEALLGRQLAKMHRHTATSFGFTTDNFIGRSVQKNTHAKDWENFWRDCRLLPQLELAFKNGYQQELQVLGEQVIVALPTIFGDYRPSASLVHGDLWGGNKAYDDKGVPVIFDPACYYGDREVDIAMTHLFGGFGSAFYRAYENEWPLDTGYAQRETLYNLYHQLNHLNLFGRSYLPSCVNMIKSYLR